MDPSTGIINWFTNGIFGAQKAIADLGGSVFGRVATGEISWADVPSATWDALFGAVTSIPDLFNTVAYYTWASIALVFPDGGTFPQVVHDSAQFMGNALASVSFMFPVQDFITVLLLSVSVQFTLTVYFFGLYLIKFIRGQ